MAVIPDYCNGLMVLCAWLIPPVHPPTHPFIDAFTSKQLLGTYHSTCRGTVGCRVLELPLGSASQCTMEVRHTPTGKQAGMGQHPEDKVEFRGKSSACGGQKRLGGRGHLRAGSSRVLTRTQVVWQRALGLKCKAQV